MKPPFNFWLITAALLIFVAVFTRAQAPQMHLAMSHGASPTPQDPATNAQRDELSARRTAASSLCEEAKNAIKSGDMSNAFSLLQQAVGDDPREDEACILLAYMYAQKGQPEGVITTLNPIVNPPSNFSSSVGNEMSTRMMYVLAQLDRRAWREALACYNKTWHLVPNDGVYGGGFAHKWSLPGDGPHHILPEPRFSPDVPDFAGLRAQAHLILGSGSPLFMEEKDQFPYMLDHLRQVLQIDSNSLDAHFISGWLLRQMERYSEARVAYSHAAQLGSPAVRKEINEELTKLNTAEDIDRLYKMHKKAVGARSH